PGPSKLNQNENIPFVNLDLSQLLFVANAATGQGGKNTLQSLAQLITDSVGANPSKSYTDIAGLLANTDLPIGHFAYVGDASTDTNTNGGWAIYYYIGGDKTNLSSYRLIGGQRLKVSGGTADTTSSIITVRSASKASWTSTNPTLAAGEIGFESDTLN